MGNRRFEGFVLGNLGVLHYNHGRMEEARARYQAALAIAREVGNRRHEGFVLGSVGNLHRDQGRIEEAHAHYAASLSLARDCGDRLGEGHGPQQARRPACRRGTAGRGGPGL